MILNKEEMITVRELEKSFKVYYDKSNNIKEQFVTKGRRRYEIRKVLKGISFNVKKGESIGLVGRNGCGKSTTLKLLTRIIYPDRGDIIIKGRVSSLLELGAGFHPDMSGRENIYLNAAVFGLTKKEIEKKVSDIINFSELEEYIENPVRTYSTGMYMRLAFSVAINVNADILLIDEILGVGDVSFQKKCFERLQEIKATGVTIVIVSHSLEQIERICDRCIWLENGVVIEEGKPNIVNSHYYKKMEDERLLRNEKSYLDEKKKRETNSISNLKEEDVLEKNDFENTLEKNEEGIFNEIIKIEQPNLPAFCDKTAVRTGTRLVQFNNIRLLNKNNEESIIYHANESLRIELELTTENKAERVSISLSIWRDDGILCYGTNTYHENFFLMDLKRQNKLALVLNNVKLMSGKYFINIGIYNKELLEYDSIKRVRFFYIQSDLDGKEFGLFQMEHKWDIE